MQTYKHFMGEDGFVWFTGVVEDRNDPDLLGRVRVRCLGYHTEDLNDIPTKDLPWAHVMHPVTDPSMQGLGHTPSFLVEGSWVMGFFLDAKEKQQPLIIGSLPGIPTRGPNPLKGFNDPRSEDSDQIDYAGEPYYGPYPNDEFTTTSGHGLAETDTSRLAQDEISEKHNSLINRRTNRQTDIPIATQPFLETVSDSAVEETRDTFDEPHPKNIDYNLVDSESYGDYVSAKYPYNHVFETEAGHITEFDDTPKGERTLRQHSSGSYEEIIADGTKTTKVIGDNFEIIMGQSNVYISGAANLTIGGTVRHLIKGDYHLEVEGNFTQKIHKNFRRKIGAGESGGNVEEEIKGNVATNISENIKGRIGGDVDVTTEGNETRINNGTFDLMAKSDIMLATTGGKLTLNAFSDVAIDTTSGVMGLKSGTTLDLKSATAMTIKSETTLTEAVGTNAVRTVGGTLTDTITGVGTITMAASGSEVNASGILLTGHTHTDPAGLAGAETSTPN